MEKMKLIQAYNKTLTSKAFFYYLKEAISILYPAADPFELAPYLVDENTVDKLDNFYFYSFSGDKITSPLIDKLYDHTNETLSTAMMLEISTQFYMIYGSTMKSIWETMQADFNPTENYAMNIVDVLDSDIDSETDNTTTDTTTASIRNNDKVVTDNDRWGFDNDADSVPVGHSETNTSGGQSSSGSHSSVLDGNRSVATDETRTITRHGTTGIYSPAALLTDSVEFWKKNFYTKYLFPYVDSVLAIPVY